MKAYVDNDKTIFTRHLKVSYKMFCEPTTALVKLEELHNQFSKNWKKLDKNLF